MAPRVSVILLNWNNWQETLNCLQELRRIEYPPEDLEIIVVDNGSSDGSAEALRSLPGVAFVALPENIGFAAGNNAGIHRALVSGFDYALLLNNDTRLTPRFLRVLVDRLERTPRAAAVSPKIYYADPPGALWYAGGRFRRPRIIGEMVGLGQPDRGQYNQAGPVDFAVGCCMLVRRQAFERVGLLDERFFFYHEDVDFSLRLQQAGCQVWYEPAASIVHLVSHSTREDLPHRSYLYARARVVFFSRHIRGWKIPQVLLLEAIRLLRTTFNAVLVQRKPEIARAYWQGLRAGWRESRRPGPPQPPAGLDR